MGHFQARGVGPQRVVNPSAEQRCFHGPMPGMGLRRRPLAQGRALRHQAALFDHRPVGGLDAEVDVFLVDVESDIVRDVHWVLLVELSESALISWSRHSSFQENLFSWHLYIQTDGTYPKDF